MIFAGVVDHALKMGKLEVAEADVIDRRTEFICGFISRDVGIADLVEFATCPAVIDLGKGDLGGGLKGISIIIGKSLEGGLFGFIAADGLEDLLFFLGFGIDLPSDGHSGAPRLSSSSVQFGDASVSVW